MNIGTNIKYLRQKNKLTQEQLAMSLGVSYQAVSKWETNANTPDISLLPRIASLFGVSSDMLFSEDIPDCAQNSLKIENDDVLRIVQMRGSQILKVTPVFSEDVPPIEIVFPRDCNDRTQYFKVEVMGNMIVDGSINGDVVCHQSIQCGTINGDVKSDGNIKVNVINSMGKVTCQNIVDCYKLECAGIECGGTVNSANLTCNQIVYKK